MQLQREAVAFLLSIWITAKLIHVTGAWLLDDEYFNNIASTDALGAPLIIPTSSDVTLEVDSNFTLRCESKRPIKWEIPELYGTMLDHKTEVYHTRNPSRPYGSELTLYNVTVENVRYYYCVERDAEVVDNLDDLVMQFKASKIYVFVNDFNNLLAPHGHPVITAFQYSDVIIPCKPASRDVDVELSTPQGETHSSETTGKYDPKIGFIIRVLRITDEGTYICTPKEPAVTNQDEEIHFLVQVLLNSNTQSVSSPKITSPTQGHAIEGGSFNLTCLVELNIGVMFTMTWITPNDNIAIKEGRAGIGETTKETTSDGMYIGKRIITIHDVSKTKDAGTYKCEVEDHSHNKNNASYVVTVLGSDENYINLREPTEAYLNKRLAGTAATLLAYYKGYPQPTLTWYNNENVTIPATSANEKYTITQTEEKITLTIKNLELGDSGDYFLRASNGINDKILKYKVLVKAKPTVKMEDVYVQVGEEAKVQCKCEGYPESKVLFQFTPCSIKPKWPTCFPDRSFNFSSNASSIVEQDEIQQIFELSFSSPEPGIINCIAENKIGMGEGEAKVLIGDLAKPVVVYGVDNNRKIAVGDEISLNCAALVYNYSADIFWYHDDIPVENERDIDVVTSHSEYSYRKDLIFKKITHSHSGSYECRVHPINDDMTYESKWFNITVFDASAPIMDTTNLESGEIERDLGDLLSLQCSALGIPEPLVRWFKDDEQIIVKKNDTRLNLQENGAVLEIQFLKPEDEGSYKCNVSNRLGSIEKSVQVRIANLPRTLSLHWILLIAGIFLFLIIFIVYLCMRIVQERKLRKELKAAGLANFEEGAVECINPALSLDEQADLLPYDRRFEFPKDKLRLGKQLGAGAFGVVLKAVAEDILPDEKETVVAVKMVKKTADNEVMRALVSELKIMVHLGQHLNVVNLLGAVTKDIAKREIMVIVEYCRYGNIQNFLLKNRKRFINQINPETDQIDPSVTTREQRWSSDYEYNSQGLKYVKLSFPNHNSSSKPDNGSHPNTQGYIRQSELDYMGSNVDSCNTEQTLISSVAEGDAVLSNNSTQPVWRSNYKPDCPTAMDITTTHLVSWAFQVARGMDYLASRKVLHGDLAARNILLCDDNVVKICDFGLARTMYKSDNYKKQGEAPLPIKWLALESLGDQIFSTYSDVWSFGIVLWEFFSLAKVPYPGMDADQTLYLKLKDGYRMDKPEFANQELYDIMLECWSANPESRPLFNVLEKKLAKLLEDEMSNHYIDLNEPYLRMNTEYYKGQTDYLALMGCPNEPAPPAPRYVNGHLLPDIKTTEATPDYLQMSPKSGTAIFSPRPQDGYVAPDRFNFPEPTSPTISNNLDSPISKIRKKTGLPEEIPMLKQSQSDSETEMSPDPKSSPKSFSKLNGSKEDIECRLQENENYVNVSPSNLRKKSGVKDAFSNPSYLMLQTINETRT